MKTLRILLLLAAAALLILSSSCDKTEDEQVEPVNEEPAIPLVKSEMYQFEGLAWSIEYFYDDEGRLTRLDIDSTQLYEYLYYEDRIDLLSHNTVVYSYLLDDNGLAVKLVNLHTYDTTSMTYDLDGCMITEGTYSYEFTNGNKTGWYDQGILLATYEYYDSVSTIGNVNCGMSFLGKGSKNLVRLTSMPAWGASEIYSYQLDEKGRVVSRTSTYADESSVFTYW